MEFVNIRMLSEPETNYQPFVRAIQLFEAALDLDVEEMDVGDEKQQSEDADVQAVQLMEQDSCVIRSLCKQVLDSRFTHGFPDYANALFKRVVEQREEINIEMAELRRGYGPMSQLLVAEECSSLVRFDSLCRLLPNCTRISVNMRAQRKRFRWTSNFLLALCDQLLRIEQCAEEQGPIRLREIELKNVKKKRVSRSTWTQIRRRCHAHTDRAWFKCLSMSPYDSRKDLIIRLGRKDESDQVPAHPRSESHTQIQQPKSDHPQKHEHEERPEHEVLTKSEEQLLEDIISKDDGDARAVGGGGKRLQTAHPRSELESDGKQDDRDDFDDDVMLAPLHPSEQRSRSEPKPDELQIDSSTHEVSTKAQQQQLFKDDIDARDKASDAQSDGQCPSNYLCFKCKAIGRHWIMHCDASSDEAAEAEKQPLAQEKDSEEEELRMLRLQFDNISEPLPLTDDEEEAQLSEHEDIDAKGKIDETGAHDDGDGGKRLVEEELPLALKQTKDDDYCDLGTGPSKGWTECCS